MALFIVDRVGTGFTVRPGDNALQAAASALKAEAWAEGTLPGGAGTKSAKEWSEDSALSAATAEAASGPTYASTALGLAATTSGQAFAVDAGGGLVSVYLNSSGTAVLQRTLATTGALAASGGSALVGFIQSGTGATARTVQSKLRDTVSVKDFGAVGDGVTDDTVAIQNAVNYAVNNGFAAVYLPVGIYIVSSTISMGRMCLRGDGDGSRIRPTISDGTAVLSFAAGTNFFTLDSFRIDSNLTLASFVSGAINAQNCIGIKIISTTSFSARYVMRDVVVRGCKVGYDINGFIGTLDNVWALACETGLIGTLLNSVRAHLRFEECRKDFEITNSVGLHLDQLLSEGGVLQSGLVSSTIDGCIGLRLSAPYWEQTRNVPFIAFGGTTQCRSVVIDGMTLANQDSVGKDNNVFMMTFDNVDGIEIGGRFSTGTQAKRYSTTTNTKNIVDRATSNSNSNWPTDNSKNLSVVRNHFPNSDFELWFRGWPNVAAIRGAISKETTIVRRGSNSVKFTPNAGQANGYVSFSFNDGNLPVKLRGKSLVVYAWIYIPDISEFTSVATRPAVVQIVSETVGTGGAVTATSDNAGNRGQWNLLRHIFTAPSDCTRFDLWFRVLRNTGTTTGNEVFYIDSGFLIEGDGGQDFSVRNGNIIDSPLNPCSALGGLATIRGEAAPTDADQIYEVGDTVLKNTVTAGGSPGWICTTGGAGGSAVFKAIANIAA